MGRTAQPRGMGTFDGGTCNAQPRTGSVSHYLCPSRRCPASPSSCGVVEVSPLLRELILRLVDLQDRAITSLTQRISELLLEELTFLPAEPLNLPMPVDQRFRDLCGALQSKPDTELTLDAAACRMGMSRRSFMRHFERETGMTYGRWRQQARLLAALPALAAGMPVVTVALDCGYQSTSAFAATFKRSLGRSPASYFD